MNDQIRERDLARVRPGPADEVRVIRAGQSRRARAADMPVSTAAQRQLDDMRESMGSGLTGYENLADLPSLTEGDAGRLAAVTNDASAANNGTWRWTGTEWVKSSDRVSGIDSRLGAVEDSYVSREVIGELSSETSQVAFAVVDEDGRRTWLESDLSGGPTDWSRLKMAGVGQLPMGDDNQLAFAVVDEDGRRTELEVARDGRLTNRVVASIAARIGLSDRIASGPEITCVGDSLTAGAGGGDTSYPAELAALTGLPVTNLGVGGETSATIAGRLGSRPWLATVVGGSIPTTGGVQVTLVADDGSTIQPLDQGSAGINPCSIAGVSGVLSKVGSNYTFTRSTPGAAVAVNYPMPVVTAASAERRGDVLIMWWGQNDATNDAEDIIGRQRATIDWMDRLDKRWLVIGLSTSSEEYRAPMEAQFYREFGRRFVNSRAYLSSSAAMEDAGLTADADDLENISIGRVPAALRVDDTHLNAAGYTVLAAHVHERLKEMGWL